MRHQHQGREPGLGPNDNGRSNCNDEQYNQEENGRFGESNAFRQVADQETMQRNHHNTHPDDEHSVQPERRPEVRKGVDLDQAQTKRKKHAREQKNQQSRSRITKPAARDAQPVKLG
ncbi:hypothetical protein [Wenzhouxiangella sp. EGI_FJ10305]|uniref:hypothetical protein n=1 Tax=Wenzhouxiangella sp. EGI_FJ10305 TaxID=3243768 RepID=UPI0035DC6ACF